MNGFLKWFFVFMSSMLAGFGQIFKGLWNGIKQIFNIKNYIRIFKTYSADFGALGWILSVLAIIVVVAIFVLIIFMIVLAVRKYIRFRHSIVSNEDLIEEISDLQRQVVKMTKEKDEIMAMKVAQLGVYDNTALAEGETKLAEGEQMPAQGEVQTIVDGVVQTADCRFSKLIEVDNFYKTYEPPAYNNDITLSGICEAYRNFACSRMHLYYDIKLSDFSLQAWRQQSSLSCKVSLVQVKHHCHIHSVSSCRKIPLLLLFSRHGVTELSFSATSTSSRRTLMKQKSSKEFILLNTMTM